MRFYNTFGTPSKYVYCKREVLEVILVEIPGGVKGEYLFKAVPLDETLPGVSKVRDIFD